MPSQAVLPVYLAAKPNLNDFVAFADAGWDGNWYVGYNSCWIVQLPPAPFGSYTKAFLGAKLGRAKTRAQSGKAFDQEAIPGKIYMAVASTPAFTSEQTFFLADTRDIPLQPDPNLISGWVGQPGWLWTEVPLSLIREEGPNYLALWSDEEAFLSVASAPVVAAAMVQNPAPAWLNRTIRGAPPRDPKTALETQLARLVPALAIRLVPVNAARVFVTPPQVDRREDGAVVQFAATGQNIGPAWCEISYDLLSWQRHGPFIRQPPFQCTLGPDLLSARDFYIRGAASDELGNTGLGEPLRVGRQP